MVTCKDCAFYGKECESESQQRAVGLEPTYEPCEIFCPKQRLIDAGAFKNYLEEIRQEMLEENTMSSDFAAEVIETVQDEYLQNAPTVDAAPVVHGEWIDGRPYVNSRWKVCSVCHCTGPDPQGGFAYCPNCGAKMDGGKANEM